MPEPVNSQYMALDQGEYYINATTYTPLLEVPSLDQRVLQVYEIMVLDQSRVAVISDKVEDHDYYCEPFSSMEKLAVT